MKRWFLIGWMWACGAVAVVAAEEKFSTAVRAEDFSAAGLGKLTPDELARLDALVRDYKSGALVAAKREAEAAERARVAAEAKAEKAEAAKVEAEAKARAMAAASNEIGSGAKKSDLSLLSKAKVLLTPGTEVEYSETDSRIAGNFTGWEGKAILTLENGQRWLIVNGGSYSTPPIPSPKVKITPAALGGFWMQVEGMNQRVRVSPLGGGK